MPRYNTETWDKLASAIAESGGSVQAALDSLRAKDPAFATLNRTTVYRALARPGLKEVIAQKLGEAHREKLLFFQEVEENCLNDPQYKDKTIRQLWEMAVRRALILSLAGDSTALKTAIVLMRLAKNLPSDDLVEDLCPDLDMLPAAQTQQTQHSSAQQAPSLVQTQQTQHNSAQQAPSLARTQPALSPRLPLSASPSLPFSHSPILPCSAPRLSPSASSALRESLGVPDMAAIVRGAMLAKPDYRSLARSLCASSRSS